MRIEPFNNRILVSPVEIKKHTTESGIELIQDELCEGIVVEISNDLKDLYNIDDHVLYSEGAGRSQYYDGKLCYWLNATPGINSNSDVWGRITEDELDIDSL